MPQIFLMTENRVKQVLMSLSTIQIGRKKRIIPDYTTDQNKSLKESCKFANLPHLSSSKYSKLLCGLYETFKLGQKKLVLNGSIQIGRPNKIFQIIPQKR